MRWLLIVLAVVGIVASSLALREHYRTDLSPCSINERWDCGIVNHSPYAMLFGIPVAVIGIAGYLLLGVLAFMKSYRVMLVAAMGGLGFALHCLDGRGRPSPHELGHPSLHEPAFTRSAGFRSDPVAPL